MHINKNESFGYGKLSKHDELNETMTFSAQSTTDELTRTLERKGVLD